MTSPSPASVPTEEDVARGLCEALRQKPIQDDIWAGIVESFRQMEAKYPTYVEGFSLATDAFRLARAAQALFAPILAEKEREIRGRDAWVTHWQTKCQATRALELSAQTALASAREEERERCARVAEDYVNLGRPDEAAAAIRAQE